MLCILSWKLFWQVGRNILDYRSMLLKIIEIFSFLVSVDSIFFGVWLAEPVAVGILRCELENGLKDGFP